MADATAVLIAPVFMGKLLDSGLYGKPQDGLADRLKERAPDGLTEAGLLEAAERIIRQRGSGAFPKFPECMAAIEDAQARTRYAGTADGTVAKHAATEPVTSGNYAVRIEEFLKRGKPYLLKREGDADLWCQWIGFYDRCNLDWHVRQMINPDRTEWTTPGQIPVHFDPTFTAADNLMYSTRWRDRLASMQNGETK